MKQTSIHITQYIDHILFAMKTLYSKFYFIFLIARFVHFQRYSVQTLFSVYIYFTEQIKTLYKNFITEFTGIIFCMYISLPEGNVFSSIVTAGKSANYFGLSFSLKALLTFKIYPLNTCIC